MGLMRRSRVAPPHSPAARRLTFIYVLNTVKGEALTFPQFLIFIFVLALTDFSLLLTDCVTDPLGKQRI